MTDFSHLLPEEIAIVKALDPRQATIRTVNYDHQGNVHVLLKFDHEYVKNMGVNKDRLDVNRLPEENIVKGAETASEN